ncbi:MAG: GTPase HflX [Nitrososphaerales archaeon]
MQSAILVTYPNSFFKNESNELARAAGYQVIETITQRFLLRSKFGIGAGKVEELRVLTEENSPDAILFDEKLRPSQIYNLAKVMKTEIIDRENVILQIFSRRANSAEAKLQVQLAQLRYEIPRAREKVRMARLGEQPGFLGLGGYEVDVYYNTIKKRISDINAKLAQVRKRRNLYRENRARLIIPTVSLSGYTGAGKTTLFNVLTGEDKDIDQGSFTTLLTSSRAIREFPRKVVLSDTVGFISRLPAYMIEAFRSTLEEITYSDLVILVLDVTGDSQDTLTRYQTCIQTLADLRVPFSKTLITLNKADLVEETDIEDRARVLGLDRSSYIVISAKSGLGLEALKTKIVDLLGINQDSESAQSIPVSR